MHVIKGAWVGQTLALAKSNDSGQRKSRIRRSKEERKAMVESFIKKYQKSNNGNFPSLNLTHKEVGGSFYTVREIVRDIIQENRVLGPPKFTLEEQDTDRFLEQYPLGSISIEPQIHLPSLNETHILPNHDQGTSEELVLNSSGLRPESEDKKFDDGQIIVGNSQAVEKDEEYDETRSLESQPRESLEVEKNIAEELEASKAKKTHITADVIVETFLGRSVSTITYVSDRKSSELRKLTGTLEENETEKVELEASDNNSVLDRTEFVEKSSGLTDEKAEVNLARPLLERNSGLADDKAEKILGEPSLESSNGSTTKECIVLDINDGKDLDSKDALPAATQPVNTPNGIHAKNLNRTDTSSSYEQSISQEATAIRNNPNVQHGGSSQKGSKPTLHRINLESWEATEKSAAPETNLLLALLKAFIAIFVKFWHYLMRP
ncbi:hypothetical protein F0562_031998 [Nyssa sinensis]|uniref:AT3G52170-like helix-turn-helix domain-containing protein n=1 Tax=Nyssa sinensis TaxID=561372 RepID=A0A5J5AZR5_9ASTE|nr:hypothetical protein F0562_031998 [Nyssa sinensis]